jgi:hypothetical protein
VWHTDCSAHRFNADHETTEFRGQTEQTSDAQCWRWRGWPLIPNVPNRLCGAMPVHNSVTCAPSVQGNEHSARVFSTGINACRGKPWYMTIRSCNCLCCFLWCYFSLPPCPRAAALVSANHLVRRWSAGKASAYSKQMAPVGGAATAVGLLAGPAEARHFPSWKPHGPHSARRGSVRRSSAFGSHETIPRMWWVQRIGTQVALILFSKLFDRHAR